MKKLVAIAVMSILLMGCQPEGREYVEHKELSPLVEWLKKDVIEFKVPIEKENQEYQMSLAFRYTEGFEHKTLKVKVVETSPSGKETSEEYALTVLDEYGDYIGEHAGAFIDSEHVVEKKKVFKEKGTFSYKIEHMMPTDPVSYSLDIGLILDVVQ